MKAIFRILGTAAAVAATGAAIVIMDKFLNEKAAPFIESIEFPEDAEQDDAEAAKTAEAYAEGEAKAVILNAEAEAEAIRRVAEAVASTQTDPATYILAMKYIDTLREMTSGKDNKTVYIPYEASSVISSIGSISSLFPKK